MKKVKFNGKLSLNKETVVNLNDSQMSEIQGGSNVVSCGTCPPTNEITACHQGTCCDATCSCTG